MLFKKKSEFFRRQREQSPQTDTFKPVFSGVVVFLCQTGIKYTMFYYNNYLSVISMRASFDIDNYKGEKEL